MFNMSQGRKGIMGEAGTEGVFPLKRGKDGKLGVQATGGGMYSLSVSVPITVPFSNKKFEANLRSKIEGNVPKLVQQAIKEMM
jgi:phage-related minor tail protein